MPSYVISAVVPTARTVFAEFMKIFVAVGHLEHDVADDVDL